MLFISDKEFYSIFKIIIFNWRFFIQNIFKSIKLKNKKYFALELLIKKYLKNKFHRKNKMFFWFTGVTQKNYMNVNFEIGKMPCQDPSVVYYEITFVVNIESRD